MSQLRNLNLEVKEPFWSLLLNHGMLCVFISELLSLKSLLKTRLFVLAFNSSCAW